MNTKIHAVIDGLGNPVEFLLSPGTDHDSVHAVEILGYVSTHKIVAVIPPKSNRWVQRECDWWLYKERHLIECFFQKIKWFHRIATRYYKTETVFLGFVYLAAIAILVIYHYIPLFSDKA